MESDLAKTARDINTLEKRMRDIRDKRQRRLDRVQRERSRIAEADEEYARLERALREARSHRNRALLPGKGKLTLKNADVMRVWVAIQQAFTGPFAREGLPSNQLYRAMRAAIPDIPDSTMRSHLHRFKGKKALSQIGSRWFLERPASGYQQNDTSPQPGCAETVQGT